MGVLGVILGSNDLESGFPVEKTERTSTPKSSYHDGVVKVKLRRFSWLESLDRFLDPAAQGFALSLSKRMNEFDVKVIHCQESGELLPEIKCTTPSSFENAMIEDKERTGTIVIAKGLSRTMVETLGTKFDIDPAFFASHLAGTEPFRMGIAQFHAEARSPIFRPSSFRKSVFYTAEFRRPYHVEGGWKKFFELIGATSTPRGAFIVGPALPDAFVSEKISVYRAPGSNIGKLYLHKLSQVLFYRAEDI